MTHRGPSGSGWAGAIPALPRHPAREPWERLRLSQEVIPGAAEGSNEFPKSLKSWIDFACLYRLQLPATDTGPLRKRGLVDSAGASHPADILPQGSVIHP